MKQYDPNASAQQTEFKSVSKILSDAEALIAAGEFHNAVNRIGDALATAQVAMDMQAQRDNNEDTTDKVERIMRGVELLGQLTAKALPESMDVAQFYQENKPFDITK